MGVEDTTRPVSPFSGGATDPGESKALALVFFRSGSEELVPQTSSPLSAPIRADTSIGRSSENTLSLPCRVASRAHARVELVGGIPLLRDLGSKNGTFLNGQKIREGALSEADVVRIGSWVGVVTAHDQSAEPAEFSFISDSVFGGAETRRFFEQIQRVAQTDLRIVLIGETGTGKEVFAQEIHRLSRRRGTFVAVNCAAIPEHLAEGELFGYRKGAFTGAERANPGHFRAAHGGTLFLDEVLDTPLGLQPKLLRVLEERRVVPLGQSHPETANPRVISASQVPLLEVVEAGRFRADLYARLAAAELEIPPLRRRRSEVWPFLSALLERKTTVEPTIDARALEQLLLYDWPLNVRELVQLAERLVAFHGPLRHLQLQHLPERIASFSRNSSPPVNGRSAPPSRAPPSAAAPGAAAPSPVAVPRRSELARRLIEALDATEGNVSAAAERVGISRPRAYRLLRRLPGVSPNDFRFSAGATAATEGLPEEPKRDS